MNQTKSCLPRGDTGWGGRGIEFFPSRPEIPFLHLGALPRVRLPPLGHPSPLANPSPPPGVPGLLGGGLMTAVGRLGTAPARPDHGQKLRHPGGTSDTGGWVSPQKGLRPDVWLWFRSCWRTCGLFPDVERVGLRFGFHGPRGDCLGGHILRAPVPRAPKHLQLPLILRGGRWARAGGLWGQGGTRVSSPAGALLGPRGPAPRVSQPGLESPALLRLRLRPALAHLRPPVETRRTNGWL